MRALISFTVLFVMLLGAYAQIRIEPSDINFQSVEINSSKSLEIILINDGQKDEYVTSIDWFNDVIVSDFKPGILAPNARMNVRITFSPKQNIRYDTELIIRTNQSPFAYRADLRGDGVLSDPYYTSTFNLWDEELKAELKRILASGYISMGYNAARDAMYGSIDLLNSLHTCVYTGRTAQFNTRAGANSNNFNTEHTWPQSLFNSNEPERSDLHHLFPTDVSANSTRGNSPFGIVSNPSWSSGGSKSGSGWFEPRDVHKGAVARAMFYFAIRYTNYSNFLNAQESALRQWHQEYPPSAKDSLRNKSIYAYQKNKNPFIDVPAFTERITSISMFSPRTQQAVILPASDLISFSRSNEIHRLYLVNTGNKQANLVLSLDTPLPGVIDATGPMVVASGGHTWVDLKIPDGVSPQSFVNTLNIQYEQKLSVPLQFGSVNVPADQGNHNIQWNQKQKILSIPAHTLVIIYDASGRKVHLTERSSALSEIILNQLPAGMYFVHADQGRLGRVLRIFITE